jgi:3,4-dihydroxy 2-butanone 4-phosphate synthase / GTP cyclohydrolase II
MDYALVNKVEEGIEEIRKGKLVIVSDDNHRENEGDFICAAELITSEIVNFMTLYGRGLLCVAITEERCKELQLNMMVENNTALNATNFTVSVDLTGNGCTTGISTDDRAKTIKALANPFTKPQEFGRPGHIFPIKAHPGGLRVRPGHTEVSVLLPRLAGLQPVGALIEIMNPDGSMARFPDLEKIANFHNIKMITTQDLLAYLEYKKIDK